MGITIHSIIKEFNVKLYNLLLTSALLLINGISNSQVVTINGFTRDFDATGNNKYVVSGHKQDWLAFNYPLLIGRPLADYFLTDNLVLNNLVGGGWRVATGDDMVNWLNNFHFEGANVYIGHQVPSYGAILVANSWLDEEEFAQSRSYYYDEGAPIRVLPLLNLFHGGTPIIDNIYLIYGRDDNNDELYNDIILKSNDINEFEMERGQRDFVNSYNDRVDVTERPDFVPLVRDLPTIPPNVSTDALGNEFVVNNTTLKHQRRPSIATDANGNFIITWAYEITKWHQNSTTVTHLNADIYARVYQSDGTPLGNEFRVNSSVNNSLTNPDVAMNANGKSVVIWQDFNLVTGGISTSDVYAQCFNTNGLPIGGEIKINQFIKNLTEPGSIAGLPRVAPKVAMDASGGFVVTWHSLAQDNADLHPEHTRQTHGVFARRYLANCSPADDEFQVNTFTTSDQINPDVTMADNGDFVITWESRDQDASGRSIYAQRFLADGSKAGVEFRVSSDLFVQETASIASSATGDFVITWDSVGQDGSSDGVYAQLYQADGTKVGNEFLVNTHTELSQKRPQVAMSATGGFSIIWQGYIQEDNTDPTGLLPNGIMHVDFGVFARRYFANGTAIDSHEFVVNSEFNNRQERPAIAMDSDGDIVTAWQSWDQDDLDESKGIYAQRFKKIPTIFKNGFEQ